MTLRSEANRHLVVGYCCGECGRRVAQGVVSFVRIRSGGSGISMVDSVVVILPVKG